LPGVVRKLDKCSGHGSWPPRSAVSWSPNVFVNNKEVERKTDQLQIHTYGSGHGGTYQGIHKIYANNLDIQIKGDPISCGSKCNECSPDVFVE
jgi:hypothetical protein